MIYKKHKFKGRELLECLKRIKLKTVDAGDIIQKDGEVTDSFTIVIDGQCSRHLSMMSRVGKAMQEKFIRSATSRILDDDYPKYMSREINRIDDMDFSPNTMLKDIKKTISSEK